MTTVNIGENKSVLLAEGDQLTVTAAATARVVQKALSAGDADVLVYDMVAGEVKTFGPFKDTYPFQIEGLTGTVTYTTAEVDVDDQSTLTTVLGAVNQPTTGKITCNVSRVGFLYRMDFTFDGVEIAHTDATTSGSSGSHKIFDFVQGAIVPIACRHDLTLTGDDTIDGDQGDMAGVVAFGSAAANAGDGALSGTEVDFAATAAFTLSSYVDAIGTTVTGQGTPVDGTGTAVDLYLNESGSAATSEATGVITVDGTASFLVAMLGDD